VNPSTAPRRRRRVLEVHLVARIGCLAPVAALVTVVVSATPAAALTAEDIDRATVFTSLGLQNVVERLASDDLDGRNNDTSGSARAQRYLIAQLRRIGPGLDASREGDDAYRQPFTEGSVRGTNLLAVIRGRELPDEYVIVGAHYDHLGRRCPSSPSGNVCNGATDNATGTAEVIAVGNALRRLPEPPRRSVVLALWDAEEDGLVGSRQYVLHPIVPLDRTAAYVNFDIQGADLLPSLAQTSFALSAETGGADLQRVVADAIAAEGLGTRLLSYIFGQLRSDYANFVAASVPTVFFSDSTGACYHKTGDDAALVDYPKLRAQSRISFRVVASLAESRERPQFVAPNPAFATFDDAIVLREVIGTGLTDLHVLPPADRARVVAIQAAVQAIVDAGPAAFDTADVQTLINAALDTIDLLTAMECPGRPPRRRALPTLADALGGVPAAPDAAGAAGRARVAG